MADVTKTFRSPRQQLFWDMVLGTLVYAVVLGFFEDYTNILSAWSYSTTFFVAITLQILTYLTLRLKSLVIKHFKGKEGKRYRAMLIFGVWAIMFFSKFVFIAVIESIFGSSVVISGFVGLVIILVAMTVIKKLIDISYARLA